MIPDNNAWPYMMSLWDALHQARGRGINMTPRRESKHAAGRTPARNRREKKDRRRGIAKASEMKRRRLQ